MDFSIKISRIITNENVPKCPLYKFVYACECDTICPKWMPLQHFCSKAGGSICIEWKRASCKCGTCWIAETAERMEKGYVQTVGFCTL